MSNGNHEYWLSLPVCDTVKILEHMGNPWGWMQLQKDAGGDIGGIRPRDVAGIAQEWVDACGSAMRGHSLAQQAEQGRISGTVEEATDYQTLMKALRNQPDGTRFAMIEGAQRAFSALADPSQSIEVTPEDALAARILANGMFHGFSARLAE